MTVSTPLQRLRARFDRLPPGWAILLAGAVIQICLAGGLMTLAIADGDRLTSLVAVVTLAVSLVGGLAVLPAVALLWVGRGRRLASALALVVGLVTLLVNEGQPIVWPLVLSACLAAVRVWFVTGLDTTDLLRLDPQRFERVDPPSSEDD